MHTIGNNEVTSTGGASLHGASYGSIRPFLDYQDAMLLELIRDWQPCTLRQLRDGAKGWSEYDEVMARLGERINRYIHLDYVRPVYEDDGTWTFEVTALAPTFRRSPTDDSTAA